MRFPPSRPSEGAARTLAAAGPGARALALSAALILLAACRLHQTDEEVYFDLEADASLIDYSRVTVVLQDSLGRDRATLFDDSLTSTRRLHRLPAGPYRGGPARIVILGFRDGRPAYRETRVYDGMTQQVLAVDIFLGPFEPEKPVGAAPKPPYLAGWSPDTLVSIRDSVSLWAEAMDPDGDLEGYGLDCDGDGKFEDSAALRGGRTEIRRGRRFTDSGEYACRLRIWDAGGRGVERRLGVKVEQDPPRADAGTDTIVMAGTAILLHARGDDKYGPILTREWKLGTKPFAPVTQQETVHEAPAEPGLLTCILRVTDSDGLSAEDTLLVTVIPRTGLP